MKKTLSFLGSFALVSSLALICFAAPEEPEVAERQAVQIVPAQAADPLDINSRRECKEACKASGCTRCEWHADTKVCLGVDCPQ